MSHTFSADVESLIHKYMATGRYRSENDLVRDALEQLEEVVDDEGDLAAILEGLDDVDRGEPGMSVDEAFRWILERHSTEPPK